MRWRIFYSDGSTFGHEDGDLSFAPYLGVITIVQDATHPCQLLHMVDFYWWRPDWGRWIGGDIHGFIDQCARYGGTWVKQGETIRPEDNQDILGRAGDLKRAWDAEKQ